RWPHGPRNHCRQRSSRRLRYDLPLLSPRMSQFSCGISAKRWAGQRRRGHTPRLSGTPVVVNPAGEAHLADLARSERENNFRGLRRIRGKGNAVLAEKCHHRHERDALVAIDKSMIPGEPECVSCGQYGKWRFLVTPFVVRSLKRRSQHAFVSQARSATETAELAAMDCNCLFEGNPK